MSRRLLTVEEQERARLDALPGRAEVRRPTWNRGVDRRGIMKTRIMYIEGKGEGLTGPARIGRFLERSQHDRCPTLEDLARTPSAAFDPATMRLDAWGQPFELECQGARVRVRSLGPDRMRDTHDDLWAQ